MRATRVRFARPAHRFEQNRAVFDQFDGGFDAAVYGDPQNRRRPRNQFRKAGPDAVETWRIRRGRPRVGVDLGDPTFWTGGLLIIEEQLAAAEQAAKDAGRL